MTAASVTKPVIVPPNEIANAPKYAIKNNVDSHVSGLPSCFYPDIHKPMMLTMLDKSDITNNQSKNMMN